MSKIGNGNLIPVTERSKEEARAMAVRGGYKSGEVRKKKKELKQRLMLGLEIFTEIKAKQLKKQGHPEAAKIIKEIGIDSYTLLDIISDDKTSAQVKLTAVSDVLDRIEGKPVQKSVVDATVSDKEINDTESEMIKRQIEKEAERVKRKTRRANAK